MTSNNSQILTLNMQDFRSSDAQKKATFIQDLERAFKDIGFVIIKDHPVTEELQKNAYEKVDQFFTLPKDQKDNYAAGKGGERGYTTLGVEHSKDNPVGDLKEFFQWGATLPKEHPNPEGYPENKAVETIKDFNSSMEALYAALNEMGMDLLRAIAIILDQEEEFFTEKVRYGNSKLRAICYPPLRGDEEEGAVRSAEHEDINLITLLIGASTPGLQAKNKAGEWIDIQTQPHEIAVNVGDMLQRLSNYVLVSTTHRVINPPQELAHTTRYSMPFFLHPVSSMSLAALSSCVSEETPMKDPATTAGEYLNERLREIGLG